MLPVWHCVQAVTTPAGAIWWLPVRGQPVTAWLNVESVHWMVSWQVEQFEAAKAVPADWCGGLLVCCQVVRWQPEFPQSVGEIDSV